MFNLAVKQTSLTRIEVKITPVTGLRLKFATIRFLEKSIERLSKTFVFPANVKIQLLPSAFRRL